jgi:hypothetical protein
MLIGAPRKGAAGMAGLLNDAAAQRNLWAKLTWKRRENCRNIAVFIALKQPVVRAQRSAVLLLTG